MSTQDNFDAPPLGILLNLLVYKVLEVPRESRHEGRARGDTVTVECGRLGLLLALAFSLGLEFLGFLSRSESSRSLLVHLGSRSDSVDGHEEYLKR